MATAPLLRIATLLGAVPLGLGTLIYSAWRLTRWHWLELAGLWTLVLGFVAVVAGAVALVIHQRRESRGTRAALRGRRPHGVLVGALLVGNFPAAIFYTLSAIDVSTRYTVRVHNESGRAIDSVIVTGPGVRAEIGPVAPGQHVLTNLHFAGDGSLMFSVKQQELHFGGELDGYVTGGLGGDKTIRIGANRVFAIRDSP